MKSIPIFTLLLISSILIRAQSASKHGDFKYDDFKTPKFCGAACHSEFYQQWKQAMMSQSYVHHWDEIEYFNLAVQL